MTPYYEENGNECACGCHEHVSGLVRGKPKRFVSGHNLRLVTEKTEIHRRRIGEAQRRAWQTKRKRLPLGSKNKDANGYVRVKVVEGAGRWPLEHTLVIEAALGRKLQRGELIHHINLVPDDNRIENLYLCSGFSEHQRIHASADRVIKTLIDAGVIQFNWDTGEYEAVL